MQKWKSADPSSKWCVCDTPVDTIYMELESLEQDVQLLGYYVKLALWQRP